MTQCLNNGGNKKKSVAKSHFCHLATRRVLPESASRRNVYEVRTTGQQLKNGAIAQLVAHLHGMERVGGSNPPSSTTKPSACIWWFLRWFMAGRTTPMNRIASFGAIAQLVAHLHGMERVGGSNPPSSTTKPSACIWWFLRWFMAGRTTPMNRIASFGAIAQLVAHLHGMERVGGSNPPSSTDKAGAICTGLLYLACTLVVQHSEVQQGV